MKSTLPNSTKSGLVKIPFLVNLIFAVSVLLISSLPSTGQTTIKTVGSGGDYTTLKMAFDEINAGDITGNIELQLISNQTGINTSAILNESGVGGADYTSVVIYPTNPSGVLLEGNLNGAIIRLDGADNVTIDGRINRLGSSVDLTIRNLSTNSSTTPGNENVGAVLLINGASNNTLKYTKMIFHGGNLLVAQGSLVIAPSTIAGKGNNDNVIEFCHFTGSNATTLKPASSIWINGATDAVNERIIIRNNQFYDNIKTSVNSRGIAVRATGNNDFLIEGNSFFQTVPLTIETDLRNHAFINIQEGQHTVRKNYFGGSGPQLIGTFSLPPVTTNRSIDFWAIVSSGSSTNLLIEENEIGNFDVFLGRGFFQVISVESGSATIRKNVIGSATTVDNFIVKKSLRGFNVDFIGISLAGSPGITTASGNKISGISTQFWDPVTDTASNQGRVNFIGIRNSIGTTVLIDNNTIGGTLPNSIHAKSLSIGPLTGTGVTDIDDEQIVVGILNTGTGNGITISNNTIQNLVNASDNADKGYIHGIQANASTGTANITGNTIENLKISNNNKTLGSLASVVGISSLSTNPPNSSGNHITGITNDNANFEGEINGIAYASLAGRSVAGNFIKDLSPTSSLSATVNGIVVTDVGSGNGNVVNNVINFRDLANQTSYRGIADLSSSGLGTVGVYFNTVVFAGSSRSTGNSYTLFSNSNVGKNYRNNNLYNAVENSGTGINAALGFGPSATLPAAGALNYNNYFTPPHASLFLVDNNGSTYTDLSAWQTASSRDANSLNLDPEFSNLSGSNPNDFRVGVTTLEGTSIGGITTDFSGITRAATPTIGALEYCVAPSITSFTPTSGSEGTVITITGTSFTGATAVLFNGIDATSFTVNSDTEIEATVPAGNVNGKITVVTPCNSAESSDDYTGLFPLIVYLDAADPASYSGSGVTWTDLSVEGNDGTLINSPTFNGTAPESFTFNGTNQYVTVTGGAALSTDAYTKMAWIKLNGFVALNNIISGGGAIGDHALFFGGTNTIKAGHNGAWTTVQSTTNFNTGEWYFVAVTFNTTTGWKLYVNGVEEDSDPSTTTFNVSTPGTMYLASYNGGFFLDGDIAYAKVYNDALPDSEILNEYNASVGRFASEYVWTGNNNQNGNEAGNWNNGVPPAGSNIRIPDGATPYPVFNFDFEAGDIVLEGDATLTIAPNRVLTFAAGKGASRPVGGTGKIILKSDATGDASIGNLTDAGSIGVPVLQERYVAGGNRAFRFFSHPYTSAIPLSVVANVIDITGAGGSVNGFTDTDTNNPSAFRFSPISSDGSESAEDAGWIPFTNTSQTIGRWEAIRILFRGSKGQANSLLDVAYTPDPVTIEWEGTINQGTQVIPLVGQLRIAGPPAVYSDWNLVGNPFPSAITLTGATHSISNSLDYAVWRPRVGNGPALNLVPGAGRGGLYVQEPLSTGSIIIPSGGGFFIRAGGTSATLTIPEPSKTTATTAQITNVLRQSNEGSRYGANTLQIHLTDGEEYLDRVLIFLNEANKAGLELEDAPKMANPAINFFTVSEDDWALAIDRRPYNEQEGSNRIPLHILAPAFKGYTLTLPDFDMESGNKLRLYDRFTDTYHDLNQDFNYTFEVTADPRSKGHRFDIVMGVEVVTSLETLQQNNLNIFLMPNPAEQQVAVTIQRSDVIAEARVRILDSRGVQLYETRIAPEAEARIDYPVNTLPKGVYVVEVVHGTQRMVKRLLVK